MKFNYKSINTAFICLLNFIFFIGTLQPIKAQASNIRDNKNEAVPPSAHFRDTQHLKELIETHVHRVIGKTGWENWQKRLNNGKDLGPGVGGQFMFYGALNYSISAQNNLSTSSNFSTVPSTSLPLGLGYFINDYTLLGVNYAFSRSTKNGKKTFLENELGIWYSPFVQVGQYFLLILQVDLDYTWGRSFQNSYHSTANPDGRYNGFRARAYPMFGIILPKGFALKFKFGEIALFYQKYQHGGPAITTFTAGISGAYFATGISKNVDFLGVKKKARAKAKAVAAQIFN